jgi:hypothetical protein
MQVVAVALFTTVVIMAEQAALAAEVLVHFHQIMAQVAPQILVAVEVVEVLCPLAQLVDLADQASL